MRGQGADVLDAVARCAARVVGVARAGIGDQHDEAAAEGLPLDLVQRHVEAGDRVLVEGVVADLRFLHIRQARQYGLWRFGHVGLGDHARDIAEPRIAAGVIAEGDHAEAEALAHLGAADAPDHLPDRIARAVDIGAHTERRVDDEDQRTAEIAQRLVLGRLGLLLFQRGGDDLELQRALAALILQRRRIQHGQQVELLGDVHMRLGLERDNRAVAPGFGVGAEPRRLRCPFGRVHPQRARAGGVAEEHRAVAAGWVVEGQHQIVPPGNAARFRQPAGDAAIERRPHFEPGAVGQIAPAIHVEDAEALCRPCRTAGLGREG